MEEEDLVYFNPFAETEKSANRPPHWQQAGATYFIMYRLADAVPAVCDDNGWRKEKSGSSTIPSLGMTEPKESMIYVLVLELMHGWMLVLANAFSENSATGNSSRTSSPSLMEYGTRTTPGN